MPPGKLDAGHGAVKIALAALGVGDSFRPVQAGTQGHTVFCKEFTELIRQQPQVALYVQSRELGLKSLPQTGQCLAEEVDSGSERFSAVEGDIQFIYRLAVLQIIQPAKNTSQNIFPHHCALVPRPETVAAPGGAGVGWDQHELEEHYSSTPIP